MRESQASFKCAACGCVAHEGMKNCPQCGASLSDALPVKPAPTATEHLQALWAEKRTRTVVIVLGVLIVCAFIGAAIYSLVQDAALKEHARAVAEGETTLVQGGAAATAGTCSLGTDSEWFFADSDQQSVVKNLPGGGWQLQQSNDGGATWNTVLSGTGSLMTASLSEDELFYSLTEDGSVSTLRSQSLSGQFTEYPNASNVVALSATKEMVVTKSAAGEVGWLNKGSGIWHDLQEQLDAALGQASVRVDDIRAFGTQAIASLENGQIVVIDVNTNEAFVAGDQEG